MTGWKKHKIGDIADLCLGKMLDDKKNRGEPLPYLANVNVRWGEFDLTDLREMRFESHELDRYGLRDGDIVMCEGGEPGRCAIWKSGMPGIMIQKALHRIRPHDGIDPHFLYYSLLQKGRMNGFAALFTGSTIKHLPKQMLELVEVMVPPLSIQKSIASILSAYDDLIENNRRRIALLEESARLLYREWFVRLRFPGHEHTRIVNGVPEGWRNLKLGDICTDNREMVSPESLEPDTPYIGLEHMPRRSISLSDWGTAVQVTSSKLRFNTGDILFGKIRPYFHKVGIAFTDGVVSSDAFVIRPTTEALKSFVLMTVSSDEFIANTSQAMKEGSKMPRADWKQMVQYPVLLPPEGLRADFSETITSITDQLRNLSSQNQKIRTARDLLLPKLMSGEIEV